MAQISEASSPRTSSSSVPSPAHGGRATAEEVWEEISLGSLSRDPPDPLISLAPNSLSLHNILNSRAAVAAAAASTAAAVSAAAAAANTDGGAGNAVAVDPRKKRMMKNRESAARSRARKQAYANELEKEVDHLAKENRRLKFKYEMLLKQTLAAGLPEVKKRKIQRTVSASF
ncbi:protein FD-like [Zingiber officinale]|uniref:protein FD-like n=1 Tax=Zingiber officinale TaxID=94328 RepID=UPI001C4DC2D9|nr:protein FD-like [Zingiber officinale]XP_042392914.1 protein FD-like [Zingiber officinale]